MVSIRFSEIAKRGMIDVLARYAENDVVDSLIATLKTPGETVLSEAEALILAGLVRPYYHFISDCLTNHPAIGDGKLPSVTDLQAEVERLRAALQWIVNHDQAKLRNGGDPEWFSDNAPIVARNALK